LNIFISAPFFTSLTKLIPVLEASNLENKASLFSEFSLEQLEKSRIIKGNKTKRFDILYCGILVRKLYELELPNLYNIGIKKNKIVKK
jgi:hypothetical protein